MGQVQLVVVVAEVVAVVGIVRGAKPLPFMVAEVVVVAKDLTAAAAVVEPGAHKGPIRPGVTGLLAALRPVAGVVVAGAVVVVPVGAMVQVVLLAAIPAELEPLVVALEVMPRLRVLMQI
jgi:hypothetical protein